MVYDSTMESKEHDSVLNNKTSEKNNYEDKFNTLRIISLKAIHEFEDLQKKCEENYSKYLEERENYLRTKKELDVLKEVSGEALGEYENLHRKFAIEQECRDKAEEYAMQQVKANKQLKRQSTILLNTLVAKAVDFDLEELASESDSSSLTEDHGICNKQIEGLKQQVESFQIQTDKITEKLHLTEQKLKHEMQEHIKTKEELENNRVNFKQLNRVSLLALDDYSNLQQKYEMEVQYRAQAEKLAVEESKELDDKDFTANRDHEAVVKQSELLSKELSGEDRLKKALEEISNLTKKLNEQETEFEGKVKELEEELASSNDVQKLKSLEEKIHTFAQGMETLESRLTQAQQRASEAETKAKKFEELLKKAQTPDAVPPPAPPPPPPPPPAPAQLLKKFVGIITTGSGKKNTKKSKSSLKDDPRVKAMSEMMERIKTGKVELKKIAPRETLPIDDKDGSAMENLRDVLKSIKSPTKEDNEMKSEDEQKHTFGVHLRKAEERKPRSRSESDGGGTEFKALTLRKPRSQSTGDMLEDDIDRDQTMDKDLYKLLQKQKAAAEREENSQQQQNEGATQQTGKASEENGKSS